MTAYNLSSSDFAITGTITPLLNNRFDSTDGYIARLGNANTIKGLVYYDENSNGIKDAPERGFAGAVVKISKNGLVQSTIPQENGFFRAGTDTGAFTTTVQMNNPYFTVVPASANSNFATYFNTDSFSFAVRPIPGIRDLNISVVNINLLRPGFTCNYELVYKNAGTTTESGTVLFKRDSRLIFGSSTPAPTSIVGDTLKWNYSNLKPFETRIIRFTMSGSIPPVLNIRDIVSSIAIITPLTGDHTPIDDTAVLREIAQGSYDPNNKADNWGGTITEEQVASGDYIDYTIRFQNTGTDTAFAVIVKDTLDTQVDWNTLQMISASHPYQLQISSQNKLTWTFDNINLPDSNINEPASHGFIAYRVKPLNTLVTGDIVHNSASIYFDFNLPVLTNNVQTLVGSNIALPLSLLEFTADYQHPHAVLKWSSADEYNVEKFDIERSTNPSNFNSVGSVKARNTSGINEYRFTDDLSAITGDRFFYRLRMADIDGRVTYSPVQELRRNEVLVNAIVISPNPVNSSIANAYISFEKDTDARLSIIDMQGRQVISRQQKINKGHTIVPFDIMTLKKGMYIFEVRAGAVLLTTRFIIAK
jgi:uncharacterized repeat protein (TIGR01451 family)